MIVKGKIDSPCQRLELLGYRAVSLEVHCKVFIRVRHFPAHLAASIEWAVASLVGLSIEVAFAEAFATHPVTTATNIDGEGCLEGRVPVDGSDDHLGDGVVRDPVKTHGSFVILENIEVVLTGSRTTFEFLLVTLALVGQLLVVAISWRSLGCREHYARHTGRWRAAYRTTVRPGRSKAQKIPVNAKQGENSGTKFSPYF